MSFTRFHDDPERIQRQLQISTSAGRYAINVPGNGIKPCFMLDPAIRMQKWGGNLRTNKVNLESDLLGLHENLNMDVIQNKTYVKKVVKSSKKEYPNCIPFTDQTRATHPAWMLRDITKDNMQYLHLDPQENVQMPFENNVSTRIVEKNKT